MEHLRFYEQLYQLQDHVLATIFDLQNSFYLTGGTALHRFHLNGRYSDDLDIFANSSRLFSFEYKDILRNLQSRFSVTIEIDGYNFKRILITEGDLTLKTDFVNDMEYRVGIPQIMGKIVVDNLPNILTNKISAILGRDEPKDVFDLLAIADNVNLDWQEVLSLTKNKISFEIEELIIRLEEFPLSALTALRTVHPPDIVRYETSLQEIIKKISLL